MRQGKILVQQIHNSIEEAAGTTLQDAGALYAAMTLLDSVADEVPGAAALAQRVSALANRTHTAALQAASAEVARGITEMWKS